MTGLSFINPLFLLGFLVLPVLWFLLRVMPPSPKKMTLPTIRFLQDLEDVEKSPAKTPWWLILLRMTLVALIILALARPVMNPQQDIKKGETIRIVIDNGWAAAPVWDIQKRTAQDLLVKAKQNDQPVSILFTAPQPGQDSPYHSGLLTYSEAKSVVSGARFHPWPSDYGAAAVQVRQHETVKSAVTYWLSSGLETEGLKDLTSALQERGDLVFYRPAPESTGLILSEAVASENTPSKPGSFTVMRADNDTSSDRPVMIRAFSKQGSLITSQSALFSEGEQSRIDVTLDIDADQLAGLSYVRAGHKAGAAGTYLLGDRFLTKTVGIVSRRNVADATPLVESGYYLKRALSPYVSIVSGTIEDVIAQGASMVILSDIASMPNETRQELQSWVEQGGLLVQFAGPSMAEASPVLVPVALRRGGRALEGIMTWDEPLKIEEFSEKSPFYGFDIPKDVRIRQMVLAQPGPDLEDKTWARLQDGTPLITSDALGQGRLVLIHTAATPKWSDLPLSGLYVEILRQMSKMAGKTPGKVPEKSSSLSPVLVLDGEGALKSPESYIKPIPASEFATLIPNSYNPPGLYDRNGYVQAFNLGDRIQDFKLVTSLEGPVETKFYSKTGETRLMTPLLTAALGLALLDWMVVLAMSGLFFASGRLRGAVSGGVLIFAFTVIIGANPAHAESTDEAIAYASQLHLAYMQTDDETVNNMSRQGLEQLARVLQMRTSVEPAGVAAINLDTDSLAFFPLIYWPVTQTVQSLTSEQASKIQAYLDNGGMILFDTRDQPRRIQALEGIAESPNARALRRLLKPVNIPPLVPVTENHVLTKSFYLLQNFPGHYSGGSVWVEEASTDPENRTGLDGVTRVVIGSHDWARAWASSPTNRDPRQFTESRRQEMAFRFGVNLVMYALTGNYKSDQVHVPFILERLGQ